MFDIRWSGTTVGKVVAISEDHPSPPAGHTAGHECWTWTSAHFDTSGTVSFPSISPDAEDGFWMRLIDGTPLTTEWYGVGLTQDLIGTGSAEIRFTSVEVPSAGSVQVYLLE